MSKSMRNKLTTKPNQSDGVIMFRMPNLSNLELHMIIAALDFSRDVGNLTPLEYHARDTLIEKIHLANLTCVGKDNTK